MSRSSEFQKLYEALPKINCQRKCQQSCGPVLGTRFEVERIKRKSGVPLDFNPKTLTCNKLGPTTGECLIYHLRPMICRLFGLVKKMQCPHGCEPEYWLTDAQAKSFLQTAEEIDFYGKPVTRSFTVRVQVSP